MSQTIAEYKLEGQEKLARYIHLLAKNKLTDGEIKEITYISDKFGEHPLFIKQKNANYDARAMHPGFGSPDCSCHISPPCQSCVDWTNFCEEREEVVTSKKEPGCVVTQHDCEVTRSPA